MKIYTRTGDAGTTSLVGGKRVSKASARLEAYGTVDELNSFIGLLLASADIDADSRNALTMVQNKLFNVGAYLATDNSGNPTLKPAGLDNTYIEALEQQIDRLTERLPQLHSFILPGGTKAAAIANVCRTVCRRAERHIVALGQENHVDDTVTRFINRLSDYLFTLGRHLNHTAGIAEPEWQQ